MSKNFVFVQIGDLMVSAHTKNTPSNQEWEASCRLLTQVNRVNRAIVYTEGGGPNAFQRKMFREAAGDKPPKSAVMMDSPMIRTIITAMNLFSGGTIKAFATNDWEGVFTYIGVPPEQQQEIKSRLEQLKRELVTT